MQNRIAEILEAKGISQAELARRMGTSRQQVNKLIARRAQQLDVDWLSRLSTALDVPISEILGQTRSERLAEPEVAYVGKDELQDKDREIARLLYPQGRADVMLVRGTSLSQEGYLPGDRILVDLQRQPRDGDIVVAQVHDDESGTAETILRLQQRGFLVPRSQDRAFATFALGDNHVTVMAVVVGRYRAMENAA